VRSGADVVGVQEPEGNPYDYLGLSYLGAMPHGRVSFAPGDLYVKLKPGRDVAGLFLDDGYSLLARTSFRIR
jgi:hypothetical protein